MKKKTEKKERNKEERSYVEIYIRRTKEEKGQKAKVNNNPIHVRIHNSTKKQKQGKTSQPYDQSFDRCTRRLRLRANSTHGLDGLQHQQSMN